MKVLSFLTAFAVVSAPLLEAARKKEGPWPAFQVGVTGIMARPEKETILPVIVTEITPGTPADGKVRVDDVIVAINGVKLEAPDPRPVLGDAITAAEAGDGGIRQIDKLFR